jgi:hypothetical protein
MRTPEPTLANLDNQSVVVELLMPHRPRHIFRGLSPFEQHCELAPVLRIAIEEPEESFEIMLQERKRLGRIDSGREFGCDYFVRCE